ncbi:MAG: response regulator transcription factor [Hydrogenophilus sp.]|nr:response regulator transcription factor [Hydrogenophilus sp.]
MMSSHPARVVIVEDHPLCRKGLQDLLESPAGQMKVVAALYDPQEARELLAREAVDLVLVDVRIGTANGIDFIRTVKPLAPACRFVILTMSDSAEDLAEAIRLGVSGYLLKDMDPEDLLASLKRTLRGELVVAPTMASKLSLLLRRGEAPVHDEAHTLTERERQILSFVALGMSNKQIARELKISPDTVKLHVRHILAKLNLPSRVAAAVFAVERQLVDKIPRHSS